MMDLISELFGRSGLLLTANFSIAIILVSLYFIVNLVVVMALIRESRFYPFSGTSSSKSSLRKETSRGKKPVVEEGGKEIDSFANMLYFLRNDYDFASIRIKDGRAQVIIEKRPFEQSNKVRFIFEEPKLVKILDNLKDRLPLG
jgi:hypothetical protein